MTVTPAATTGIPGYVVGTWTIDPVHTDVSFTARHMMVSKVRGHFVRFEGKIVTAENPLESSATATIDAASISTNNDQRDAHLQSLDFLEVETYPALTYRSTGLRQDGDDVVLEGELTIKGVTKAVPLHLEVNGFGPDAFGGTRAGFSASGEINRKDFGVNFNGTFDGGGVIVSDTVRLLLEVEAILDSPAS